MPQLERVEDRTLLSTVTSLLDNGMPGTLRYEIAAASSGETIDFDPDLSGTIRLSHGELVIDKSLTIEGPGADRLAISGHRSDRIFHVAAGGVDVVIAGLTITDGRGRGDGGGILNAPGATLTVAGCNLIGNVARGGPGQVGRGGGIFNATGGTLSIADSTFVANQAWGGPGRAGEGGGLYSVSGTTVTVTDSTFTRNLAIGGAGRFGGHGGGAGINAHGRTTVLNSTIIDNRSTGGAGAYGGFAVAGGLINENAIFTMPGEQGASLTLVSSTIAGNRAVGGAGHRVGGAAFGAGLLNLAADLTDTGSTIVGNQVVAGTGHFRGFALGGGVLSIGGAADLRGTSIAGNRSSDGTANDVFMLASRPGGVTGLPFPVVPSLAGLTGAPAGPTVRARDLPGGGTAPASPNIAMLSATTPDSRGVTVTYQVAGTNLPAIPLAIYRSADARFDPTADLPLGGQALSGADLTPGNHTVTVTLPGGLPIDPAHPYVLAVADPGNVVAESNEADNLASFRTFVIGAVAHGLELNPGTPAWIGTMAASLRGVGYDVAIPFDWSRFSSLPVPGLSTLAGQQLAGAIVAAAQQLQPRLSPGDVIDLHLIGHSRGGVVVSQVALALQALEQAGALPALKAGWLKMTLLDPHPADDPRLSGTPGLPPYSVSGGPLGRLFVTGYNAFVAGAQDPAVVVPGNVDEAEVYYQRTDHRLASSPNESPLVNLAERIFIPWGDVPVFGAPARYSDLTGIVHGHYEVHDWYQQHVVPTLGTAGPFVGPGPTATPSPIPGGAGSLARPSHAAVAYEARVLAPAVFNRPTVALPFLRQLGAAEEAFARGRLEEAIGRGSYLIRYVQAQARRGAIAPGVVESFVGQILPVLGNLQGTFPGLLTVRSRV